MDYIYSLSELMMSIFQIRLLIVSLIALLLVYNLHTRLSKSKNISLFFIIIYTYIVLSLTVFDRNYSQRIVRLMPLWSYLEIVSGNYSLLLEVIINIFMLAPLGFLLPHFSFFNIHRIILFGFLFSLLIECNQFILAKGWFECDDIIHNTLGIVIGYIIYKYFKNG